MCIYVYIYAYICIWFSNDRVCVCVGVCLCMRVYVCLHTCIHIYFEFGVREYNILLVLIFQRMSTYVCVCVCVCVCMSTYTGWRRPIWCLIIISHFLQKSPIISGSFAKNDPQLKASYDFTLKWCYKLTTNCTGWRRPIGCLKLQVIFRKRATNYGALSRKMTYKHKASYGSSPPCKGILWVFATLYAYICIWIRCTWVQWYSINIATMGWLRLAGPFKL